MSECSFPALVMNPSPSSENTCYFPCFQVLSLLPQDLCTQISFLLETLFNGLPDLHPITVLGSDAIPSGSPPWTSGGLKVSYVSTSRNNKGHEG